MFKAYSNMSSGVRKKKKKKKKKNKTLSSGSLAKAIIHSMRFFPQGPFPASVASLLNINFWMCQNGSK